MSDIQDAPDQETAALTFADLDIDARVLQALSDVGYESPSPIQAATIPPLLEGRDVVGLAQTGTGKTAAFAVPILSRIDTSVKRPQALVLAPTRELALQVAEAFGKYSVHIPGLSVLPIYGGQAYGVQLSGLRRGAQVIVGTPGRVIDHLAKGTLDISELEFLVLDEADEMLTMGFQEDVERILADTPDTKQVALFSATMPGAIRRLSKQYLKDPQEITVKSKTTTSANISQRWVLVSHQRKLDALTRILEVETFEAMIIFVRTKQATEDLAERLRARGFSAAAINGDIVQAQRERTINQLKNGTLDILVATDVAARGLDVERISHVVNYDIPHDTESYVHRIGRTGRAGRTGDALLFVAPRERHLLKAIERATRQPLAEMQLPTVEDVNAQRVSKFNDSITEALASDHLQLFRTFIEDYEREHDVPLADIAAALAVLSRDGESFLMEAEPEPVAPPRREREPRERPPRRFDDGPKVGRDGQEMTTYRIAVGKRHRVQPGAIVGAIANEGGLRRGDFGHISIRADHSLVELPKDLSPQTLDALRSTRISGVLIQLQPDSGAPSGRPSSYRGRDDRRGDDRRGGDRRDHGKRDRGGKREYGDSRGGRSGDFTHRSDRNDRGGRGGYRD
ncbi:DEAD/DEAH box helicase [Rhodococcus pyridinivorans]|jgi:ATP-dependent RNA helicase DeaD|uniref:ATP-dependent RNA helicase DeaD n=8 Tax=Rhodococcus TaxID=1827 RepID=V9XLR7_9NOCA|nr:MULTISPECIES: DEAD/DEAH box helicase [Rhodococcus]AHD23313.1 cold-shock protein [Rhodococcus pyridinivorans SB3094]EHK81377.1 dead/deah box helicase [Rhodococcus pyridinivorans AK37]KSZ58870.1 cold-shock protein [Rhodococcus pyridinivorans KG-16]MBX4167796.1 DEAD/DEAH box helicase [Rhodococcus sp. DMU2021]MCD2116632.1 DEAD/DEAH box helicase [Rhodococcus pyridinivorans]